MSIKLRLRLPGDWHLHDSMPIRTVTAQGTWGVRAPGAHHCRQIPSPTEGAPAADFQGRRRGTAQVGPGLAASFIQSPLRSARLASAEPLPCCMHPCHFAFILTCAPLKMSRSIVVIVAWVPTRM